MNIEVKDKTVIAGVRKDAGKKKLKKDKAKKRRQIDDLFDKVNQMIQVEWNLEKLLEFSNEMRKLPNEQNSKYEGIKARRGTDKKWNKLFDKLNNLKLQHSDIFADKELGKMVNDYIDYSFGLSSLCLAIDIYNKNVPIELQPTKYIDSGLYHPYVKLSNHMTQLLNIIANKIDDLQNIPKTERQQP